MQRIILLIFTFLTAFHLNSFSQSWKYYRQEIHFGIGASNFLGELGGANQIGTNRLKDLEFSLTRPTLKVGYRYMFNPYLKGGADLLYGRLNGDDQLTKEPYRNNRNLHFRSPIVEFSGFIEFYPFTEKTSHMYRLKGVGGNKEHYFSPYITVGFGGFWFNPRAKYPVDNKWHNLQPLQTENVAYKKLSICIPVGIGIKYSLSREISIGFEMSGRKTFTDYIDDVSTVYADKSTENAMTNFFANPTTNQIPPIIDGPNIITPTDVGQQRGDPSDKDSYLFAIFSIHYRFLQYRKHLPKL